MRISIYRIIDPITGGIVYVGQAKWMYQRLSSHMSSPHSKAMKKWVKAIKKEKKWPTIELIESVSPRRANAREQYWINKYRKLGANLLNTTNRHHHYRVIDILQDEREKEARRLAHDVAQKEREK